MIPYKLSLQNFLSYKTPQEPLDFSQMHLAVLIGQNGHGKSALLDAMTWALWGKARASDDALMHLGSTEMQVDFEFMLGGQLYRVERKRHRRGKTSKPRLDLFIRDADEARWQPLTESNVKATQRKIEDILRMDYDTFEHTAFLKQGAADAFTTATPGKRKSILGKVLNLAQYDRYAARARELARALQREVDGLDGRIQELAGELARRQDYEEAVKRAEMAALQTRLTRDASARTASEARLALQALESKQEARAKLARRVTRARQEHEQSGAELTRAQKRLAELQTLAAQKEEAALKFEQWRQAQAEEARWNQVLAALRPLEREEQALVRAIDQARAAAEKELALQERQLAEAEAAVAALPELAARTAALREEVTGLEALAQEDRTRAERLASLRVEMKQARQELKRLQQLLEALPGLISKRRTLQEEVAALAALEQENQARAQRLAALAAEINQSRQELAGLEKEAADLKERKAMLERGETDACPVCQRPLGETGRAHVLQEYAQELARLREAYSDGRARAKAMAEEERALRAAQEQAAFELRRLPGLQRQLAQLMARLEAYEGEEASLTEQVAALRTQQGALQEEQARLQQEQADAQARLAQLSGMRRELAGLESRLEEARRQESLLPGIRTSVRALQTRLESGLRPDLQEKLAGVRAQLAKLNYDESAHRLAQETQARLQDAAALWRRVEDAEARLPEETSRKERLAARWQREEETLKEDERELATLDEALQALPEARRAWEAASAEAEEAHRTWEAAHAALAAAQQKLAALDGVRRQRQRLDAELTAVKSRMHRYQMLEKAFGRDGLQAMIIEAALPELETEANRLLARLSEGRMNVRLETQREKKTGGVKEALDIIISDELGSRPYELYSGGEAFRVDLALRIALSRLLARRAGAALQTLFIDEGFGTQDAQGRENLVEAIHMIKDEFALILVITHIDELKDQFPVRILVEKREGEGSVYRVM
jgi:exonuclease SbcC